MQKYLLFVLFFFLFIVSSAQNRFIDSLNKKAIDSLNKVLLTQKEDTNRVWALLRLSTFAQTPRSASQLQLIREALSLSEKLDFKKGKARAYFMMASDVNIFTLNNEETIKYLYSALKLFEELGDKPMQASCLLKIGSAHQTQYNFPEALNSFLRCLKISEEIDYKVQVVNASNAAGSVLEMQGKFEEALEKHLYATKIASEAKNLESLLSTCYARVGSDYVGLAGIDALRGEEAAAQRKYNEALQFFKQAVEQGEKFHNSIRVSEAYWHFGRAYMEMKKYDLAKENFEKALKIATPMKNRLVILRSYEFLSKVDSLEGNYQKALEHYKKFKAYIDSSLNDETIRKTMEAKIQYEFGRKEDSLKMQQQLTNERLKQQQLLAIQQQQKLQLQEASLKLSNQQKKLNQLAFLRAETQLQAEQSQSQEKEKQLVIVEKEKALQQSNLKLKTTELNLKEKEIKAKNMQRNLIVTGAFAILTVGGVLWRNNRNKQKAYALLEKQKMRTQIASDLHDDIGSTLTSISYYSELVKMQVPAENSAVKTMLDKIGNNARTIVHTMSDIVWVINPDNDLNGNLISRMRSHANELCKDRNIECSFEANDEIKDLKLNMQQRKNLYFIFKEALHNAVKYASCSKINVALLQSDHQIELAIKDNGKGFNLTDPSDGNGLTNMKRRAAEINAILNLETCPNNGTAVLLKLKIT
jgi:two-component system, NarL family, sensor histidine kinase UhpB